jgi:hypothetical protein
MNNKKKYRLLLTLSLILLSGLTALQSFAGEGRPDASVLQHHISDRQSGVEKTAPEVDPLSPLAGERVWPTDPAPLKVPSAQITQETAGCVQLIVNPNSMLSN